MNVGILTYYGVFNHGAVLQANALKTVINSMGHNCDFIQFNRNYDMIPQEQVKKYNISVKSIFLYAQYLKKKGIKNTVYNLKKNVVLKGIGRQICRWEVVILMLLAMQLLLAVTKCLVLRLVSIRSFMDMALVQSE